MDDDDQTDTALALRDRDESLKHVPERDDHFDFRSPKGPVFHACQARKPDGSVCGERSTIVPCYDCARRAEKAEIETEERARRTKLLLRSIPEESRWATLDAPELAERVRLRQSRTKAPDGSIAWERPRIDAMAARIIAHPGWLTFWGPARSGKTSLAVACLRARGRGLFVSSSSLAVARAQYGLGEGEAPLVAKALRASLLLLDDLGEEQLTNSPICDVLKERFRRSAPTWVTTGLVGAELGARYGQGIRERLTEAPRAWIVPFGDRDGAK